MCYASTLVGLWQAANPSAAERDAVLALVETNRERVGQWLRGEVDSH